MAIMQSPEYRALTEEIEILKAELTDLIALRDDLLLQVCPQIETEYMHAVGALECDAYRLECQYRRLKRKLELIRMHVNRQEIVDISQIEAALEQELLEFQSKLEQREAQIKQALERLQYSILSPDEASELKRKYHKIVKALHPDVNPNATEASTELYVQAVQAYQSGDLGTIRLVYAMLDMPAAENSASHEALQARRDLLKEQTRILVEKIAQIKVSFPYNQQSFLADKDAVAICVAEVQRTIEDYKAKTKHLKVLLSEWEVSDEQ